MSNKIKILVLILLALFSACDVADIPDMFINDVSVNDRFNQSMEWNAGHPFNEISVISDDYLLYIMSDSHIGDTKNLTEFFDNAIKEKASAIVMVGDLSTGHKIDLERFQKEIPSADSVPSFCVIGNHDLYFDGWDVYFSTFGSSVYYFTIKTPEAEDLYICLDSGGGTLGNLQIEWLKNILINTRPDYRKSIVFTHNNFFHSRFAMTTNPHVEELYVLLDLFYQYQVDLIITGHDHVRNFEFLGNTTYITLDALEDRNINASYFILNIKDGNIKYNFYNF